MADIVSLLFQAKIDPKSISNIQNQIKEISKTAQPIKIKIDIDSATFQNIKEINEKLNSQLNNISINTDGSLDKITHQFKYLQNGETVRNKVVTEITNNYGEQVKLVQKLNNETSKLENKTLTIINNQKQNKIRIQRLGEKQADITDIDFYDDNAIKEYTLSLQEAGTQITKFQRIVDSAGNSQIKMRLETQQGKNMIKQQSVVIDENTKALYRQSEALKPNTNRMLGWVESINIAIKRTIQWAAAMTLFYGNLRKLQEGLEFIKELDKDLNQVAIITGMTKEETDELARSYAKLGIEMGKTVSEISQVNTELIRQGLTLEESQKRLDTILKLSATGNISTSQALQIITSSVNAMGEESEKTADIMLKSSQISASSVEEMGEAFTKTASSAKSTGMELTELSAIISGLVEVTQESPSSLGSSVKTLLARFNRVNEETGELNESLNDVQKAFESVGVAFLDSEEQIRPVYELLTDLNNKWADLDKNTKMYIATQAAGVRQQNRFLAIMDNFSRIQEINNELMEAGGTLNESYARYLTSVEAAANKARASLEKMWINTINSETIRDFYNISTIITNVIDKIGLLRVAIFTLSTTMLLANKRWREFSASMVGDGIVQMLRNLSNLAISFDLIKIKAIAARASVVLLQGALTFGLSMAITFIIEKITQWIGKAEELKRANEEAIQSFNQNVEQNNNNIKRLKELESQYDSIKEKIENNIDLTSEEKLVLQEIVDMTPSIVKGYTERGEAIYDTTKNISDLVEELEKANQLEDFKLKSKGEGFLEQAKNEAKDAQKEIERLNKQLKEIDEGRITYTVSESYPYSMGGKSVVTTKEIKGLEDLRREYEKVLKTEGERSKSALDLQEKIRELETERRNTIELIELEKQKLSESTEQTKLALAAVARQSEGYKNLSSDMKQYVADYIKTIDVLNANDFIDLTIAVEDFTEALSELKKSGNDTIKEIQEEYNTLKQQFIFGEISANKFNEGVGEIVNTLSDLLKLPTDILSKIFPDSSVISNTTKDISNLDTELKVLNQELENAKELSGEYLDSVESLGSAYEKLSKGEKLSADTLLELIQRYPEVAKYIAQTNDVTLDRGKIIEIVAKKEYEAMIASMENELTILNNKKEILYKTLLAESTYHQLSLGLMSQYYKQQLKMVENNPAMKELMEQIEIQEASIAAMKKVGFDEIFNPSSLSSSSYSSVSEFISSLETRYRDLQLIIDELNKELDINNEKLNQTKDDSDKISLLRKRIDLIKQLQEATKNLTNEQRHEREEIIAQLKELGITSARVVDDIGVVNIEQINNLTGETGEKIENLIEKLDSLNNSIREGTVEQYEFQSSIVSTIDEIEELGKSLYESFKEEYQNKLDIIEEVENKIIEIIKKRGEIEEEEIEKAYEKDMERLEERHEKRLEALDEELNAFRDMINERIALLEDQYDEEDYLKQLQEEREKANEIQRKIDELALDDSLEARNKVIELEKELAEQNEKIAEMQRDRELEILKDNLEKQLEEKEEEIEKEEEAENASYERRKSRLEREYQEEKERLERKYSDYSIYLEAREALENGYVENYKGKMITLEEAYVDFENRFGQGMSYLGDKIKNEFIDKIEEAINAVKKLNSISTKSGSKSSGNILGMSDEDYAIYLYNKRSWEEGTITKEQMETNEYLRKKYGIKEDKYNYWDLIGGSGGFRTGGVIDGTGLAKVHGSKTSAEVVFSASDAKKLWEFVKQMPKYYITKPTIPRIPATSYGFGNINLTFNVSGNLDKTVLPDIKRIVKDAIRQNEIEKNRNLNKIGVFRGVR